MPTLRQCPRSVRTGGGRKRWIAPRKNDLGRCSNWLIACTIKVEFSSVSRESDLSVDVAQLPRASYSTFPRDNRKKVSAHSQRTKCMESLLVVLDFLFGCHHVHLSRVFTLQGETYKVCCDCGAKFAYSLETMSIERRLPLTPVLTRFRLV